MVKVKLKPPKLAHVLRLLVITIAYKFYNIWLKQSKLENGNQFEDVQTQVLRKRQTLMPSLPTSKPK